MKERKNYYEVLHVQFDAPAEIIKASYRALMQHLNGHPDRGGDSDKAALINRAYATLSNATKRANYDRECALQADITGLTEMARDFAAMSTEQQEVGQCPFCSARHHYRPQVPPEARCSNCRSPLYPAERHQIDQSGQRKIDRIGKRSKLIFYTRWPQLRAHNGITDNISTQGMMFVAPFDVTVGSVLKLRCTQFETIAKVANCREEGKLLQPEWHIGVEFLTILFRSQRGIFVTDTV